MVMQLSDARWSRDECLRGRTQLLASKQKSSRHRRTRVSSDVVKGHMTRSTSLGPRRARPVGSACTRMITMRKACSPMMRLRRDDDQQHPATEAQEECGQLEDEGVRVGQIDISGTHVESDAPIAACKSQYRHIVEISQVPADATPRSSGTDRYTDRSSYTVAVRGHALWSPWTTRGEVRSSKGCRGML